MGWIGRTIKAVSAFNTIHQFLQLIGWWPVITAAGLAMVAAAGAVVEQIPYTLIGVAAWSTFAATAVLVALPRMANRPAEAPEPLRASDAWQDVNEFMLFQAACLWSELEPQLPIPSGEPYARFTMLKEAVRSGGLPSTGSMEERIAIFQRRDGAVHAKTMVRRVELIAFADKRGLRPRFLFPSG